MKQLLCVLLPTLFLGALLAALPGRSRARVEPSPEVAALLKACQDNVGDHPFWVRIQCSGTQDDPEAAAEDMPEMRPHLCRFLNSECGNAYGKGHARANNLANAVGCTSALAPSCTFRQNFDMCDGMYRIEELIFAGSNLQLWIRRSDGQTFQFGINSDNVEGGAIEPKNLQAWMRANSNAGGVPMDAVRAQMKNRIEQQCSELKVMLSDKTPVGARYIVKMLHWIFDGTSILNPEKPLRYRPNAENGVRD